MIFIVLDTIIRKTRVRRVVESHFSSDGEDTRLPGMVAARTMGMVFITSMLPSAFRVLGDESMSKDMIHSSNEDSRRACGIAAGYFLYDLYICVTRFEENKLEFLIHAVGCLVAYSYPVVSGNMQAFGAYFLMWELSTPFLYLRWYCIKQGKGRSRMMTLANTLFALSFLGCRLIFGPMMTIKFWKASILEKTRADGMHPNVIFMYRCSSLVLNGLNYFWGSMILRKLVARKTKTV